jgi:hypothetical protein
LLGVAIALIVLLTAVAVHQVRQSGSERAVAWFAPYVDTTLTPLVPRSNANSADHAQITTTGTVPPATA